MESIFTTLKQIGQKYWKIYWMPFWLLVAFSAFVSPGGTIVGFSLFWFVLGFWCRGIQSAYAKPAAKKTIAKSRSRTVSPKRSKVRSK